MKKKKMIKFRLIILMVLCAGLLLGAWIVQGHLIHEPFRTNVRQAFLAPCREYIFGTDNLGRCVLPAEFFMAQRHPFMRLFLPFLLYLLSERQLYLQQHMPVVLWIGY